MASSLVSSFAAVDISDSSDDTISLPSSVRDYDAATLDGAADEVARNRSPLDWDTDIDTDSEIDWGSEDEAGPEKGDARMPAGYSGRPHVAAGESASSQTKTAATSSKASPRATPAAKTAAPPSAAVIRYPPPDDPIWGLHGILHGLAPKLGGKINRTMVLDRRYAQEKRPADVFGHNGLTPGDWFPNQMAVLFHGGHGCRIGGVYGKEGKGTYSVVVSAQYKDVDNDRGDKIIYSGPGSQDNVDPNNLPQGGSTAAAALLHALPSRDGRPGPPVRVFRSAKGGSLSPAAGVRYDGLYRVESRLAEETNRKGGLYCRFVLRRDPGQEDLASIRARSPTARELQAFAQIWHLAF